MKLLVLVKPVALIETASFNDDFSIRRDRSRHEISFCDAYALNVARKVKQLAQNVSITVLSMASEAQIALLECLKVYDIDELLHVCDRSFAQSDTLCTSYILSEAIRMRGGFDLILSGQQSTDSETGQVPAQVGIFLGIPFLSSVTDVELKDNHLCCIRYTETAKMVWEIPFASCIALCSKGQGLSPPSLRSLRNAKQVPTIRLTNEDLMLPLERIGLQGSPTWVMKCTKHQMERRDALWIRDPEQGAKAIWEEVRRIFREQRRPDLKKDALPEELTGVDPNVVVLSFLFDVPAFETSLEILSHAAELGKAGSVLVLGSSLDEAVVERFVKAGAISIRFLRCDESLSEAIYAGRIQQALRGSIHTILGGATVRMRSCMSALAALTGSGLAADCTQFFLTQEGSLSVIRPAFGGNLEAMIALKSRLQMATIRPKAYPIRDYHAVSPVPVEMLDLDVPSLVSRCVLQQPLAEAHDTNLPIIFSVGNGIQDEVLRKRIFAFGFRQAATRVAVNAFSLDYSLQVGQTGHLVHPALYVGFGIHGAFQHIVGMKHSERIIAINNNARAPIFDYADIAICCDAEQVVFQLEKLVSDKEEMDEL